jgi:hypothetical protein
MTCYELRLGPTNRPDRGGLAIVRHLYAFHRAKERPVERRLEQQVFRPTKSAARGNTWCSMRNVSELST